MDINTTKKYFNYNNLVIETHPEVYEISDDTLLLLEAIEINHGDKVLEIGTGCGIIALECARRGAIVICSDINPYAVEISKRNYIRNKNLLEGLVEIRYGDLFSVIKKYENFNVIIFNPPYLPTKSEEQIGGTGWFDKAVDGGINGLDLTKRFLTEINNYLSKTGKGYFIFSSLSNKRKLDGYIKNNNLKFNIVSSRNFNNERIDVYQIHCKKTN